MSAVDWAPVTFQRRPSTNPGQARPPSGLSAEVFAIPLDGDQTLIYAPLRRAAFVTNPAGVRALAQLDRDGVDGAKNVGVELVEFLRAIEIIDGGAEHPPDDVFSGDPTPTAVTLFLTTACNLRCHYCYASAGDTPIERMSLATATDGIDFVLANAVKLGQSRIDVNYHGGGEPTLNWSVLTESLVYARRRAAGHGVMVRAGLATNGVLRPEQVEWVVANIDGASVSFDGLPAVHDMHRPTVSGKPSSGSVMRTLDRFEEAGLPFSLRITVTADQISCLPDSIDFLTHKYSPRRIQVEPAYQLGRWSDAPTAETAEFIDAYRAAQERARAQGQEISYSAARLGLLTSHFCGVTRDLFALTPTGRVSSCYETFSEGSPQAATFMYGRSAGEGQGYEFDMPALVRLRQHARGYHDFCSGCFAKFSCSGDCYHKALSASGDGAFQGSERCHITRELTKDQILDAIAGSGGLVWHGGSDRIEEDHVRTS